MSDPAYNWVSTFRIVVATIVFSIGGVGCLVLIGGLLLGATPSGPPHGVSLEEHNDRIETGYYTIEGLKEVAILLVYLAIVAIPHKWVVRSKVIFLATLIALASPFLTYFISLIRLFLEYLPDKTRLAERFSALNLTFDVVLMSFSLTIPLSLFFSWRLKQRSNKSVLNPTSAGSV